MSDQPGYGAERLRVYHLAFDFAVQVERVVRRARCTEERADQAVRAADSGLFNIAEGATHFSPAEKARYYRIARASIGEARAILKRIAADNPRIRMDTLIRQADMISIMLHALIRSQEARK
jgi:four helix bundle protein